MQGTQAEVLEVSSSERASYCQWAELMGLLFRTFPACERCTKRKESCEYQGVFRVCVKFPLPWSHATEERRLTFDSQRSLLTPRRISDCPTTRWDSPPCVHRSTADSRL